MLQDLIFVLLDLSVALVSVSLFKMVMFILILEEFDFLFDF